MVRGLEAIHKAFTEGNLNKVFRELQHPRLPLEDQQRDLILVLSSRYAEIERQNQLGVMASTDYSVESNRIRSALLAVIHGLEGQLGAREQEHLTIRLARNEKELLDLLQHKLPLKYSKYELLWNGDYALILKAQRNEGTYLQEQVAIKVFKTISLVDAENLQQLQAIFQVSKRLSKRDGIIDIIDEDLGLPPRYFIMPFIDGVPLGRYIKYGWAFTLREAKRILEKITQAIKEGHDDQLIHQNIRPSNVLIDKWDDPQIQPFQVLEMASSRRSSDRVMEMSRYWSPEQINAQTLTVRSDQYSLALLAIELFAGRPLFEGQTVMEIMRARLAFEQSPEEVLNSVLKPTWCPPRLIIMLQRMLQQDPDRRYPDLEDVLFELDAILVERPQFPAYEDYRHLKRSYDRCRRNPEFYQTFYQTLQEQLPQVKALFAQKLGDKAALRQRQLPQVWAQQYQMLDMAMSRLLQFNENPEAFRQRLGVLTRSHLQMGLTQADFRVFLDLLGEMMARFDAPSWSEKDQILSKTWELAATNILKFMQFTTANDPPLRE